MPRNNKQENVQSQSHDMVRESNRKKQKVDEHLSSSDQQPDDKGLRKGEDRLAKPPSELQALIISEASGDHVELLHKSVSPHQAAALKSKHEIVQYMREHCELLNRVYERHREIVHRFEGMSPKQALDRLSDPSLWTELELPSLRTSHLGPPRSFTFVGRDQFLKYPKLLTPRGSLRRTRLTGYPGTGKSYLMAAMACYLHTFEQEHEPVVYIQTSELVRDFTYLVEALLLAYVRRPAKQLEILACGGSEKMVLEFCKGEMPLVFIDETSELFKHEPGGFSIRRGLEGVAKWCWSFHQRGPSCGLYEDEEMKVRLDEPFNLVELSSWLRSRGLSGEDPRELVYYTGLVPRNLNDYTSNRAHYLSKMRSLHIGDESLLRRILDGEIDCSRVLDPEFSFRRPFGIRTWFSGYLVSVLPFLGAEVRAGIDSRRDHETFLRDKESFTRCIQDVRGVMMGEKDQPAATLNGFLALGLARECILLHGKCLGLEFASVKFYKEGKNPLARVSARKLTRGVCFFPAFDDAELYVVKLSDDEERLKVHAVRFRVSAWEMNKPQAGDSGHESWRGSVDWIWTRGSCKSLIDFTYVVTNALRGKLASPREVAEVRFEDAHPLLRFIDLMPDPQWPQ